MYRGSLRERSGLCGSQLNWVTAGDPAGLERSEAGPEREKSGNLDQKGLKN